MKVKEKTIEQKYQSLSEVEHVIKRSGMYIGSVKEEIKQMFIYDNENEQMDLTEISYTPGLLKLIDEIISNSGDEFRRKDNMGLTDIEVEAHRNGHFRIKDNGGIPVVKHKEADMYVPQYIFGNLRTSSNFDDSEERDVIGTNGLGVKLSIIFSKYFSVHTADKKKSFFRSWSNNMQILLHICNNHAQFDNQRMRQHLVRYDMINQIKNKTQYGSIFYKSFHIDELCCISLY